MIKEEIKEINSKCPSEQGIFYQPYGIPVDVKEPVIYCRYSIGGMRGGSCWGTRPEYVQDEPPKDRMKVLDIVLSEIYPNISYLDYKQIEDLIHTNQEEEREYYGNSEEYKIEYIILSELESLIKKLKNEKDN